MLDAYAQFFCICYDEAECRPLYIRLEVNEPVLQSDLGGLVRPQPEGTRSCSRAGERLFRHKSPKDPLLLFYRDEPCIVIGRNQNPWKEVNLSSAENTGTPWIRRRSGGGTVYHVRQSLLLCGGLHEL